MGWRIYINIKKQQSTNCNADRDDSGSTLSVGKSGGETTSMAEKTLRRCQDNVLLSHVTFVVHIVSDIGSKKQKTNRRPTSLTF